MKLHRKYVTETRTLCTIFSTHEAYLYPTYTPKGIMYRAGGERETERERDGAVPDPAAISSCIFLAFSNLHTALCVKASELPTRQDITVEL
jgi:hypothetical protein